MSIRQFEISTVAGDALDLSSIKRLGGEAGIANDHFEYSVVPSGYCITASDAMTRFYAGMLREKAAASRGSVLIACSHAFASAIAELMRPEPGMTEPPEGESQDESPTPRDQGLLVAAGDGTLFRCRVERTSDAERRWIFVDMMGRSLVGPAFTGVLQDLELRDVVRGWWAARQASEAPSTAQSRDRVRGRSDAE